MAEHLVKRNASYLFDPSTMKNVEKGQICRLIQSRKGQNPFGLNKRGVPKRINVGDTIWRLSVFTFSVVEFFIVIAFAVTVVVDKIIAVAIRKTMASLKIFLSFIFFPPHQI